MNLLHDIKCFCLDMDGTIYLSNVLFDGALAAVDRMQKQGRVIFLTNNSSRTRNEYVDKLTRLGFCVSPCDIYGSGNATIDYLQAKHSGKSVYLLGCDSLKAEFLAAGINLYESSTVGKGLCKSSAAGVALSESDKIGINLCENHVAGIGLGESDKASGAASVNLGRNDAVDVAVIAFDKTLTYKKLEEFCRHLDNGAFFVATHHDKTCPTTDGYIPDVGSFLRLIRCVTGRSPDVICGKPSKEYGRRILSMTGLKPSQIAMVGDRLTTDMRFAYNCGFRSVLVLSGETKQADIDRLKADGKRLPDIVLDSIVDWDN